MYVITLSTDKILTNSITFNEISMKEMITREFKNQKNVNERIIYVCGDIHKGD